MSSNQTSIKPETLEDIKHLIFNKNNKLLKKADIHRMLEKAGIKKRISDLSLWQKVFVHDSYCLNSKKNKKFFFLNIKQENEVEPDDPDECVPIQEESYERIEWLGDGIIQSVITAYLWERYPNQDEGFLTRLRSKVVKTKSLSIMARAYNFQEFILMSKYVEVNCTGRNNDTILEDVFESFIAAMFIDFGKKNQGEAFSLCQQFIIHSLEENIDIAHLISNNDNYKNTLMIFYQQNFDGKYPVYQAKIMDNDDDTDKFFYMQVKHPLTGKPIGKGKATTKKRAEQYAAKKALEYFKAL